MTIEEILDGRDTQYDHKILEMARTGIWDRVTGKFNPPNREEGPVIGVFVTINEESRLRGCIGFPVTDNGIFYQTYISAGYAALEDPRFDPVRSSELDRISFEVTLLGPPLQVNPVEWKDFKRGLHGVKISLGWRSGLLLPQVAEEYDLNWKDFLEEVCIKAGLPGDSYLKPEAKVSVFSGRIIRDH